MVATIEHHQCCIKLTPSRINKWLYEITKSDTLVSNRALTDIVTKQTDTVTICSINVTQIVTIIRSVLNDSFGSTFQLRSIEEMLQEIVPPCQVEWWLEQVSQTIGCIYGCHSNVYLKDSEIMIWGLEISWASWRWSLFIVWYSPNNSEILFCRLYSSCFIFARSFLYSRDKAFK